MLKNTNNNFVNENKQYQFTEEHTAFFTQLLTKSFVCLHGK